MWLHFKPKYASKGWERKKIKIIIPLRPYPMRNRKFQKNNKKLKKLKNTVGASFQAKIRCKKAVKEGENKNYPSVPFLPDA